MSKDILGQSNFTLLIKGVDYMYIHVKQVHYTNVHIHVDRKHFRDFNEGITEESKMMQQN